MRERLLTALLPSCSPIISTFALLPTVCIRLAAAACDRFLSPPPGITTATTTTTTTTCYPPRSSSRVKEGDTAYSTREQTDTETEPYLLTLPQTRARVRLRRFDLLAPTFSHSHTYLSLASPPPPSPKAIGAWVPYLVGCFHSVKTTPPAGILPDTARSAVSLACFRRLALPTAIRLPPYLPTCLPAYHSQTATLPALLDQTFFA
ncbi:hypothetical protein K431DRAFT_30333 [Polychaeton citri CBS 116435]|uniref:Uncharacterized protein n=1 Tax=Polychaeton citri CBS 116435 TaxID=1314669 RepID=A0A9P4UK90_9PEZI|nr:hypothetical protein K431DRAFT_30333 [Polychaeton citri CBS 116435]